MGSVVAGLLNPNGSQLYEISLLVWKINSIQQRLSMFDLS